MKYSLNILANVSFKQEHEYCHFVDFNGRFLIRIRDDGEETIEVLLEETD